MDIPPYNIHTKHITRKIDSNDNTIKYLKYLKNTQKTHIN